MKRTALKYILRDSTGAKFNLLRAFAGEDDSGGAEDDLEVE